MQGRGAWVKLVNRFLGKTVCLVGGADESINWWKVSTADIVVRVNLHFRRQGGRSDFVYAGAGVMPDGKPLPELCHVFCDGRDDTAKAWGGLPATVDKFHYFPVQSLTKDLFGQHNEWLNKFMHELGGLPFTGIIATRHILMLPIKSLFVTGMDFYTERGFIPFNRHSHIIFPQVDWLRRSAQSDARLNLDTRLEEVCSVDYPRQQVEHVEWHGIEFVRPL